MEEPRLKNQLLDLALGPMSVKNKCEVCLGPERLLPILFTMRLLLVLLKQFKETKLVSNTLRTVSVKPVYSPTGFV